MSDLLGNARAFLGNARTRGQAAAVGGHRNPLDATRAAIDRATNLVRLEIELKLLQARQAAVGIGIGAGLAVVALLLAPLLIVFALAVAAAALATVMSVWLAILIVTAILFVIVGGLAVAAVILIKGALKKARGTDG